MTARLAFLAFALVPLAATAQVPSPLTVALRDADGDRVPDGLGAVVTVEGWASADAGAFGAKGPSFYVEDAGGGVAVALADRADRSVHAGDPVRVTGTLAFVYGVAVLEDAHAERRPGPPRALVPARYDPGAPEALEGRLVEIEGVVVGKSRVEVGRALSLSLDDGSVLVAFGYFESPDLFETDPYEVGDRVHVTGVAGQYDRVAPFDGSYQVYPRAASDVRRAGISMGVYRRAALIALGLLGLAVVWVTALRRQVQWRVNQLRVSEERYRTVVDLASDAIVIHDLQGEQAELNRAAREAIGCDAAAPPPPCSPVSTGATTGRSWSTPLGSSSTAGRGPRSTSCARGGRDFSKSTPGSSCSTTRRSCSRSGATSACAASTNAGWSRPESRPRRPPASRARSWPR